MSASNIIFAAQTALLSKLPLANDQNSLHGAVISATIIAIIGLVTTYGTQAFNCITDGRLKEYLMYFFKVP